MRLIVMGDLHYSLLESSTAEMREASDKAYGAILEHFAGFDADFHISVGDLTHEGLPEEFGYVLQRIGGRGRRFIQVLGNHDTYSLPKTGIGAITGRPRYHAIDTDDAVLIFLDTTKEMNRTDWGGEIDGEQLEWLQAELVKSGGKPVLIFAHHPVYGTTARSAEDKMAIDPRIDLPAILGKKHGPGFYFCGHNHVNSVVRQDGWFYIQTAACLDVPACRIVELDKRGVRMELAAIDKTGLGELIPGFITEIKGLTPIPEAYGEEADRILRVAF